MHNIFVLLTKCCQIFNPCFITNCLQNVTVCKSLKSVNIKFGEDIDKSSLHYVEMYIVVHTKCY